MLVAMVTHPGMPASAMICDSARTCSAFAFSTWWGILRIPARTVAA